MRASQGLPDDDESGERRGHGEDGQHRDLDVDRVADARREVVSIHRPVGDEVRSEPVVELVDHGLGVAIVGVDEGDGRHLGDLAPPTLEEARTSEEDRLGDVGDLLDAAADAHHGGVDRRAVGLLRASPMNVGIWSWARVWIRSFRPTPVCQAAAPASLTTISFGSARVGQPSAEQTISGRLASGFAGHHGEPRAVWIGRRPDEGGDSDTVHPPHPSDLVGQARR